MVRGLHQSDSCKFALGRTIHYCQHQLSARSSILHGWVNRNWPNTCNRVSFVQTVASDDLPILFGEDAEKSRMREHHRKNMDGNLGSLKIPREIVMSGKGSKSFETDSSAHLCVSLTVSANYKRLFLWCGCLR